MSSNKNTTPNKGKMKNPNQNNEEEYCTNGQCKSGECGNCKDCDYKDKYGPEFDSGYHPRKGKSLAEMAKEATKNGKVLGFGELLGFDTAKRIETASKRIVVESEYIPKQNLFKSGCLTDLNLSKK
jgi:hypothetical protein